MLFQSLLNFGESFQILALWLFILFIFFELLIFFFLDKDITPKIFFNSCSIIIKVLYLLLGIINAIIFWFATIFIYVYIWIVWLKFKTSLNFDFIQIVNFIFVFVFLILSMIFVGNMPIILIILDIAIFGSITSLQFYTYISRKKKALIYRDQAKELVKNKSLKEAWALLSSSYDFASKMTPTKSWYIDTKLKKHIEKEKNELEEILDEEKVSEQQLEIFSEPIVTKSDIKRTLISFVIVTFIFFWPVMIFAHII